MAKKTNKGLAALAIKQINSTVQTSTPAPIDATTEDAVAKEEKKQVPANLVAGMAEMADQYSRDDALNVMGVSKEKEATLKRKAGRPAAITAPDEVAVTFKISASLILKMKRFAIAYEEEMGEKLTQKEIISMALRFFFSDEGCLDDPSFLTDMREKYK